MYFKVKQNDKKQEYLETDAYGYDLVNNPRWNKGTAFTQEERDELGLHGILPQHQLTLNDAIEKRYQSLVAKSTDLEKHIYLRQLQDRNETLFYAIIDKYMEEVMPLVYTPVVGLACQQFSNIFRKARGIFISYPNRDKIDAILANPYFDTIEVIVVSDGERILGLGDQGAGGMGIPIGKLSLYTACAGIAPEKTLPILLDVGTDNPDLLNDPLYVGWRNKRIRGEEYDKFLELFVTAVKKRFPKVLLQWEDFAQPNAIKLLNTYRNSLCCFNDDIQGTAAIAVSAIISAIQASHVPLKEHNIVVVGAGAAGVGISNLLVKYFISQGMTEACAYNKMFLVDRYGLITDNVSSLDFQTRYIKTNDQIKEWSIADGSHINLLETVSNAKATILIGVSAQTGIFTQQVVMQMALNTPIPIIFPLSNPTVKAEATPNNILEWTNGRAIIGTGSPFPLATRNGKLMRIDQVNNCYIFPGIGLGVLLTEATRVSDEVFLSAAIALAELSPALIDSNNNLLPPLSQIKQVSKHVALRVIRQIIIENGSHNSAISSTASDADLMKLIDDYMWKPEYLNYTRLNQK